MKAARLVVLVIALGAGAAAAMLAGRMQPNVPPPSVGPALNTVEVLIAKSEIAMGQAVGADNVEWQQWPANSASSQFMKRSEKPGALEQVVGSVARSPFMSGEPIREGKLIKSNGSGFMAAILPAGKRAVSAEITPENGASGFVLPNDHVDVILTRAQKTATGDAYSSETILTNIRVLAIDQQVEEKSGQRGVVVGKIALLELDPQQAETLALSRRLGTLSLSLRSLTDSVSSIDGAASGTLSQNMTVNVVRYGQNTPTVVK
jgi:pilus assembly protein CpaB